MTTQQTTQSFLPPVPQPPHDPTWWRLDGRAGWRASQLTGVEVTPSCCTLALAPLPASLRSLDEPSGSLGGLVPPSNVARGDEGRLYLLDADAAALKCFDPCECRWTVIPCFGGAGAQPRQLSRAHGIGIHGGNLYVCDTGNKRLVVIALHGFALRAFWSPPPAANLANAWEPYAVAFDSRGRVFVSDPANGCVQRFSPRGVWEKCLAGFGVVTRIAFDCRDRLYAVVEGQAGARVSDADGNVYGTVTRVDDAGAHFPRLPFDVDAQGNLHLGVLCAGMDAAQSVFDLSGNPALKVAAPTPKLYQKAGTYLSEALDSAIYRCQWHRVVLCGRIPPVTRVRVSTYTAEAVLTADQLLALPEDAWQTKQLALGLAASEEWDCLVTSGAGRYLWLRLEFKGKGTATPELESVRVEFPRVSLRRYLPAVFGEDPSGADFTDRFLSIFDSTLRGVERQIDEQARLFDPLSTPADTDPKTGGDFLSWLASWIGLTLDRQWPVERRRQLVRDAARLYDLRGTRTGLWRQLVSFLGMEPEGLCCGDSQPRATCRPAPANCAPEAEGEAAWQPPPLILEHYQLRRWLFVGEGRLGSQAVLWGKRIVGRSELNANAEVGTTRLNTSQDPFRDPFHVYAHKFSVFVPACYGQSDAKRRSLENLLKTESPGHTQHQIVFVEPRFRIGFQAMIGLDTVVGRYPAGVTLNRTPLGGASVLTAQAGREGGPSLSVGGAARVGATTKLD
ncbi:MAG TPA: phage tail protein [Pyrinomonadaceae bacterium]|jgi:phage tail-like protein|nr:phage tail protein [Pyrinomonadaceae bacterium]